MKYASRILAALIACAASLPALPDTISLRLAQNTDGTRTTNYPAGDKPTSSCTAISTDGYTESNVGDGGGQICKVGSGDYDLNVLGSNNATDAHIAMKSGGSGDVQIECRINNDFAGSTAAFAFAGCGIRESAAQASWLAQCGSLQAGATALQCRYGSNGTYTTVNGVTGQSRPRCVWLTYDVSSGDIKGFGGTDCSSSAVEIFSTNRALSAANVYLVGASQSTTATTQVSIDQVLVATSIDAYTPSDPTGGAPTVVTEIANQNWTQGVVVALSCLTNFSGATSYSMPANGATNGFPSGTGLSFNTATCAITGTPTASDVGTRNLTVTATNGSGSKDDTFQAVVSSAPPGDTLVVASGTTVVDCDTYESGGAVDPGDILRLAAGTRGAIAIRDCDGSPTNPIVIRNDTSAGGPTIFEATGAGTTDFFLKCTNCTNVRLDGTGGWVGRTAGCGISTTSFPAELKTDCGIVLQTDGSADLPTAWIKFNGTSSKYTIKGVEVDGTGGTGTGGIGIDCNDHAINYSASTDQWREDITITQNYIHNTGASTGEGMYCGPNSVDADLPLRRITISYNLVEDDARECINGKYWLQGPNYVHHNVVRRCGSLGSSNQNAGINITDGGEVDIYSNIVEDARGEGIQHVINGGFAFATVPDDGPYYVNIYNNIVVRAGVSSADTAPGISVRKSGDGVITPAKIYNNTVVDPDNTGINFAVAGGTCTAVDNIVTDAGTTITGCTSTTNRTGTTAAQNFANAGADNYELTSSSGACNAATNPYSLTTDYEDETRPEPGTNADQGADENTAC